MQLLGRNVSTEGGQTLQTHTLCDKKIWKYYKIWARK